MMKPAEIPGPNLPALDHPLRLPSGREGKHRRAPLPHVRRTIQAEKWLTMPLTSMQTELGEMGRATRGRAW